MEALYNLEGYLKPVFMVDYEIDAGIETVYDSWTNIEVFQKWFKPKGFSIAKAEMEAKPGGFFAIHMKSPEGEISPPKENTLY